MLNFSIHRHNAKMWQTIICLLMLFAPFSLFAQDNTTAADEPDDNRMGDLMSRMYIAPTGKMLPSGMLNAAFGGSFASEGGQEYLGLISIGLGGIAEFEFSTAHVLTNIFSFTEPISTTMLKFRIYEGEPGAKIPSMVVGLRSNAWSDVGSDSRDEFEGPASPGSGVSNFDFETHQTDLFIASTWDYLEDWAFHAGFTVHETMVKNLTFSRNNNSIDNPYEQRKQLLLPFAGIEHQINDRTHSIVEVGGKPKIKFADDLKTLGMETSWYGIAGVRYFVNDITSFDGGLRYRSDYSGLSNVEIRGGLNLGINLQRDLIDMHKRAQKRHEAARNRHQEALKKK